MKEYEVITPKRDFALDAMKALAIFLVCQTHYALYNRSAIDNLFGIVSCMGVPLFFMVNGALLLNKNMDLRKHMKKTYRIAYMSVIWKIVSVICMSLIWNKNILENGKAAILNFFIGRNELNGYELGHFWYLYALVGIYTVFPLLKIGFESDIGKKSILVIIGVIAFFTFGQSTLELILQVIKYVTCSQTDFSFGWINSYYIWGQYGYCIFWFVLGGVIYSYLQCEEIKQYYHIIKRICIFIGSIGWVLLFLINRFQNLIGDANGIVIDGYYCIPTLMMCAAVFSWFEIMLKDKCNRGIAYISKNTWGIYMLHMLVGTAVLKIQNIYNFRCGIALNLVKSIWMILSSLVIICIAKKIPFVKKLFVF